MNNDLISRSAPMEEVKRTFDAFIHTAHFRAARDANRAKNAITIILNAATAIDAVEVVRCRDCKYGKPCFSTFGESTDMLCVQPNMFPLRVSPGFYCAHGEKQNSEVEG